MKTLMIVLLIAAAALVTVIPAGAEIVTGTSQGSPMVVKPDNPGDSKPGTRGEGIGFVNYANGRFSVGPVVWRGDSGTVPQVFYPMIDYTKLFGGVVGAGSDPVTVSGFTDSYLTMFMTTAMMQEFARYMSLFDTDPPGSSDTNRTAFFTSAMMRELAIYLALFDTDPPAGSDTGRTIFVTSDMMRQISDSIAEAISKRDTSPPAPETVGIRSDTGQTISLSAAQIAQLAKDTPAQGVIIQGQTQNLNVNPDGGSTDTMLKNVGDTLSSILFLQRQFNATPDSTADPDSGLSADRDSVTIFWTTKQAEEFADSIGRANARHDTTPSSATPAAVVTGHATDTVANSNGDTLDLILSVVSVDSPTAASKTGHATETSALGESAVIKAVLDAIRDSVAVRPIGASVKQTTGTDTLGSAFQIFNLFSDTFAAVEVWSDTDILFYVAPNGNIQTDTLAAQATGAFISHRQSFRFTDGDSVAVRALIQGASNTARFRVTLTKW